LGHAQFHCGNPPPAALPRTLTRMRRDQIEKVGEKSHAGSKQRRRRATVNQKSPLL
jgi:hypothetical protein